MAARWKKLGTTVATLALIGAMGVLTGATLHSVSVPEPVAASCEEDECENGECIANPGQLTGCDMIDSGSCETYSCDTGLF